MGPEKAPIFGTFEMAGEFDKFNKARMNDEAVKLELHECWMSYDDKYPGAEFLKEEVKNRKMQDAANKRYEKSV